MFGLGKIQMLAIGGAVAVLIAGGIYWIGHSDGTAKERGKSLQATINQLKERAETDAEIRDMDIADLCKLLGGRMSDDGECE